jgi:macrolide-specific efflux system membrane fusion protein
MDTGRQRILTIFRWLGGRHAQCAILCLSLASACVFGADSARAEDQIVVESALLRLIQQVEVPARTQGILSAVNVAEGDRVGQGTMLAQVDDAEAKLLQARAAVELEIEKDKVANDVPIRTAQRALTLNRDEFKRLETALQRIPGSISTSELETARFHADQAQFELEAAERARQQNRLSARLKSKELELSQHNVEVRRIVAPINGVVVEVFRQTGEWVEPGDKVVRIVRIDRLRAEGLVRIGEIDSDLLGAPATIAIDLPGKGATTFPGKVVFVSPEINPVSGQARVWVEVDNKDGVLKPGQRPKLTIMPLETSTKAADARSSQK